MHRIIQAGLAICLLCVSPAYAQIDPPGDPCTASPTTLCLNNNRFKIEVDWSDASGNPQTVSDLSFGGQGRATPVSDVWTGMWFFDPDNLDVLIHVFQGCGFNDQYWVFAASTTNVEVTLTVTDTQTGTSKVFENPQGMPFEPIEDTEAFSTCPKNAQVSLFSQAESFDSDSSVEAHDGSTPCEETSTTVCLHDGRFEVTVETPNAPSPAQKLADGTAAFPFSNPTFFDLMVNVVDGSSANGQYWVNYSMFDPIAFELTVTDHVTGETKVYDHKSSDPIFVQDQMAFTGDDILVPDGTLSGSWYAPARDGEGFIVDISVINGVKTLVLYYFTFENNDSGRQAWLVGSAPIIGNKASVPVIIAEGTQFGQTFNPDEVVRTAWGEIKITFDDCDHATIESNSVFFPAVRYDMIRLTPSPTGVQGVCQPSITTQTASSAPHGSKTEVVSQVDGGYSGSWYQLERNGEGLIFNIAEIGGVNTLVVFYFTYENGSSGRQAWLVGSAPIIGDTADVPMIIASGARFGDLFDPASVVRTPWGNVKVTWETCNLAHIEVTSESFGNVNFDVNRLTASPLGSTGDCAPQEVHD